MRESRFVELLKSEAFCLQKNLQMEVFLNLHGLKWELKSVYAADFAKQA